VSVPRRTLAGMSADEAVAHIMDNDISDLLAQAEVVRERRAGRMVSSLPIDLETQSALEAAAAARGGGAATLMRQIIQEWVQTDAAGPA
jgi:hypothetical protein